MNTKKILAVTIASAVFGLGIVTEASAESIRLRCDARKNENNKARSKISVDGRGYGPGVYRAAVTSGGVTVMSKDTQSPVGGEVEFDFDSNLNDIAEGATQVGARFIKGNTVSATIIDQDGFASAPQATTCRAKKQNGQGNSDSRGRGRGNSDDSGGRGRGRGSDDSKSDDSKRRSDSN